MNSRSARPYRVAAFTLALFALVGITSACGSDPTTPATPTPTVRPSPVPATPEPIATLRPATLVVTVSPGPPPVSMEDLEVTAVTTVRDVMAAFSGDESSCIRSTIGEDAFNAVQDVPLVEALADTASSLFDCITLEKAIDIKAALMFSEAGGLSQGSRTCIRDVVADTPSVLGIGKSPEDPATLLGAAIRVRNCVTGSDVEAPPPASLECMADQVGGVDVMLGILLGQGPADAAFMLLPAAQACEDTFTAGDP